MFKVGDKVRRVKGENKTTPIGFVGEIVRIINKEKELKFSGDAWGYFDDGQFELVIDPKAEAISLLEAEGYTVTPPKPKKTGWVNIYHSPFYSNEGITGHSFPTKAKADANPNELAGGGGRIACIQWTEGEGL